MKEKESPFNLFRSPLKKTPIVEKIPVESRAVTPSKSVPMHFEVPPNSLESEEIKKMMEKIDHIEQEIESKLEFASQQMGYSKEFILNYLCNRDAISKNSPEEKAAIEQEQIFSEKVWAIVGPVTFGKKAKSLGSKESKRGRKGKFIGSRRNWIPTR